MMFRTGQKAYEVFSVSMPEFLENTLQIYWLDSKTLEVVTYIC